jgi:invasion protein IalB
MKNKLVFAFGFVLAEIASAAAQTPSPGSSNPAQKPEAPVQRVMSDPNAKYATYGDWRLQCQSIGAPPARQRGCEIVQTILKDKAAPFAQIGLGKPTSTKPVHVTIRLPVNVSFPSSVRIAVDEKDTQPFELAWRRCEPAGCFASMPLKDDVMEHWRGLNQPSGRITFKNAAGHDFIIPMSFHGLAQALDALAKEH